MDANTISGYGLRFNEDTIIGSLFRERLAPGCVKHYYRDDCLALIGHDYNRVIGRRSAGTLQLRQDRVGLFFSCDLDMSTPDGQAAWGTVSRQDVKGCSFGFYVVAEEWDYGRDDELPLRTITEIELIEVTITSIPQYPSTDVSVVAPTAVLGGGARSGANPENALRRIAERKARMEQKFRGLQ